MKKTVKRIQVRHIGEELPLDITITENTHADKSKSGHDVIQHTDYQFECSIDNIHYSSGSRDDASLAFQELYKQLEEHGYRLRCCGTCMNFYVNYPARKSSGGTFGYCHCGKELEDAGKQKKILHTVSHRHIFHFCEKQMFPENAEYTIGLKD